MTCSAEGYRFLSSNTIDKTSRRYSRSQRYEAIGRAPCLTRCMAVAQSEDLWEVFGVAFQLPPSAPAIRNGCVRSYLPGFIQAQCNQEMPFRRKATRGFR